MAKIKTIFKDEPEPAQDTDKLVDLFRNRVELKKEFAALRGENYQLKDRIEEHRGSIERVQQKLNHLEALLLDPEWVHNVTVCYQLRRLAAHCEGKLKRFAEQLKKQREKRVQSKVLVSWNEERKVDSDRVEAAIDKHRTHLQMLEDRLQAECRELTTMGGVAKMIRGRTQAASITELEASIADAQAVERELLVELEEIGKLDPPDQLGLDIATKRSINFMILAFAQQLYLSFTEDNLAGLVKESADKSVGAVNYGSKADCDELLGRIARRRDDVEQAGDFAEVLKKRAGMIAQLALFSDDEDAVPVSGTVATVFDIDSNGVVRQTDANLLGENYFGLSGVLSR